MNARRSVLAKGSEFGISQLLALVIVLFILVVSGTASSSIEFRERSSSFTYVEAGTQPSVYSSKSVGAYATTLTTPALSSNRGDAIVVFVTMRGAATVSAVTDSESNPYSQISFGNSTFSGVVQGVAVWAAYNVKASTSDTVTAKLSVEKSFSVLAIDVTGVSATPIEALGIFSFSSTSSSSPDAHSITVASSNDLVLAAIGVLAFSTFTASVGSLVTSVEVTSPAKYNESSGVLILP
jgi:hypothetical protein